MSDLDELVTQTRFNEIHDARKRAIETKQSIYKAWIAGRINYETATRMYRGVVEDYVIEIEDLIHSSGDDLDDDYWNGVWLGDIELPNGETRRIRGLRSILELPEKMEVSYQKQVAHPRKGTTTEEVTEEVDIPMEIPRAAFQHCNHFLSDIGLELDIQPSRVAEFDYSDIEKIREQFT